MLEDDALNLTIAEALRAALARSWRLPIVFKASFDKANRSSPGSPRGPGWTRGCAGWSACARRPGCRC